jgi:hypothetical protein
VQSRLLPTEAQNYQANVSVLNDKGDMAMRLSTILTIAIMLMLVWVVAVHAQTPAPGAPPSAPPPAAPGGGVTPSTPGGTAGSKDSTAGGAPAAPTDPKIADAMIGIRDYEVTYDKTKSHAENTPSDLKSLGVTYAGPESAVAKRTEALKTLNLKNTLKDRYKSVEEKHAADSKKDFSPKDDKTTLNYFQMRSDPFSIPDAIPEELRPAYQGAGLEGEVDPELLKQLENATITANLRWIPIAIVGTMQNGPYRVCFYTFVGSGVTYTIEQGQTQSWGLAGIPVSIYASQISEDYVVLVLSGPDGTPVVRTFHVSR